jgi:hypothetical protein
MPELPSAIARWPEDADMRRQVLASGPFHFWTDEHESAGRQGAFRCGIFSAALWRFSRFAAATVRPKIRLMLRSSTHRQAHQGRQARRARLPSSHTRAPASASCSFPFRPDPRRRSKLAPTWSDRPQCTRRRRRGPGGDTGGRRIAFCRRRTPVNTLAELTAAVNAAAPHYSAEFEMSRDGAARDVTSPL